MILRRIMKHVSDQNWFAVGLDFLIVVFGVSDTGWISIGMNWLWTMKRQMLSA
jgi:hypothetical protein